MLEETYEVVVDVWENQRYKPLQGGWLGPWASEQMPFFSDITGEVSIPHESNRPCVGLPLGWVWNQDSWTLDMSQAFGHTDSEGWSYASSFDFLVESSVKRRLDGEMGRLSLVRRRRWIRRRLCVTSKAKEDFASHLSWSKYLRRSLAAIMTEQDSYFTLLTDYEVQRKKVFETVLLNADSSLRETIILLGKIIGKLQLMKTFLIERGTLERDYASRLDGMASKWSHAGVSDAQSGGSKVTVRAKPGFFYSVSVATTSVAKRLQEFAVMLCSSLPMDVDCIIAEVTSIQLDCQKEGPALRQSLKNKEDILQRILASYKTAVAHSNARMEAKSAELLASLFEASAADFVLPGAAALASGAEASPGAPSNPTSGAAVTVSQAGHRYSFDVWMAGQRYNRAVVEADGSLYIYNAFAVQQRRQTKMASSRVAALLNATIKVFANEQSRVWEDACGMLRQLSLGGSSQPQPAQARVGDVAGKSGDFASGGNDYIVQLAGRSAAIVATGEDAEAGTVDDEAIGSEGRVEGSVQLGDAAESSSSREARPSLTCCGGVTLRGRLFYAQVAKGALQANLRALSLSSDFQQAATPPRPPPSSSSAAVSASVERDSSTTARGPPVVWTESTAVVSKNGIFYIFPVQEADEANEAFWIADEPVISFDLSAVEVTPCLLPVGGISNSFEVRPRQPRYVPQPTEGRADTKPPLLLLHTVLADDSLTRMWIRALSQPVADPAGDEPPCANETATQILQQQQVLLASTVQPAPSSTSCES